MPKTSKQMPDDNTAVRFRLADDKHIHTGTYTIANGFEVCNSFLCYTMEDVSWWRKDDLEPLESNFVQPWFNQVYGRAQRIKE